MPLTLLCTAALIEGLRLEDDLPIGALVIAPVPHQGGFAGQELRQTFNASPAPCVRSLARLRS